MTALFLVAISACIVGLSVGIWFSYRIVEWVVGFFALRTARPRELRFVVVAGTALSSIYWVVGSCMASAKISEAVSRQPILSGSALFVLILCIAVFLVLSIAATSAVLGFVVAGLWPIRHRPNVP